MWAISCALKDLLLLAATPQCGTAHRLLTSGFPYTDRVLLFVTVVTHTEGFHACGGCEGDFGVTSALGLGGLFPFMVSETRLAPDV